MVLANKLANKVIKIENFAVKTPSIPIPSLKSSTYPVGKIGIALGTFFLSDWILTDFLHLPGGGIAVIAAGAGIWWVVKRPSKPKFDSPSTVNGWISRCREVLSQFKDLEKQMEVNTSSEARLEELDNVLTRSESQKISFICSNGTEFPDPEVIEQSLKPSNNLDIFWSSLLPNKDKNWLLPKSFYENDLLVYILPLPLKAIDLLWLEKLPKDLPTWVLVDWIDDKTWEAQLEMLKIQLPNILSSNVIRFNCNNVDTKKVFSPIIKTLGQREKNRDITSKRLLSNLHSNWQLDLEYLRRQKFREIQQQSQWLVAGAVFASPVPSTDLLAVSVVNGLMLKEMGKIWACKWSPETLQIVARQLVGAALTQGVVEWSSQALLGIAKLHGGSWIAAGTMQALSAAYLTRVVGRSMADWLALNNGVSELDLELLKDQVPQIVSNAAKEERVDWSLFVDQAKSWIYAIANENRFKIV